MDSDKLFAHSLLGQQLSGVAIGLGRRTSRRYN